MSQLQLYLDGIGIGIFECTTDVPSASSVFAGELPTLGAAQRRELSEENRFVISCKYNSYKPFWAVLFIRLLDYKVVRLLHLEVHYPKVAAFNILRASCGTGKAFDTAIRAAQNAINELLGLNLYTNSCGQSL